MKNNQQTVMRLILSEAQARAIADHAKQAYPAEACGLIGGVGDHATHIVPIPNAANDPQRRFHLDERAFVQAFDSLQRQSSEIIAVYHSHPQGEPIPSLTDLSEAAYPDLIYLIVGLRGGQPALAAWSLRSGRAVPVELHVGARSTVFTPDPQPPSRPQQIAIILAAILAFACMLLWSLALLPPAPTIVPPLR